MDTIYCPYTDTYISFHLASSEHIIPLSLGGANGLETFVESKKNKSLGHQIDGKLANDFFILNKRVKTNTKGHSKQSPSYTSKKAMMNNRKVRLQIKHTGIEIFDCWSNTEVPFNSSITISESWNWNDLQINRLRFIAKVALSAGYFVYNDSFLKAVKHNEFRIIMNHGREVNHPEIKQLSASVDVQFSDDNNLYLQAFRLVSSSVGDSSCIGLIPLGNRFICFVSILGIYIGMIQVPCEYSLLANEEINTLGTFICIQEKQPIICSWKRIIYRIGKILKNEDF